MTPTIELPCPVGRFAPSPTGNLHLGSLTTAIASFCHIKSIGGRWLLRLEDTDSQRCRAEYSTQILHDLEQLGLQWDGEVLYQSKRQAIYNAYLAAKLLPRLYGCQCSRKQLHGHTVYPRFCLPTHQALQPVKKCIDSSLLDFSNVKIRIQLPEYLIGFVDGLQGLQWSQPQQQLGDVVLRRQDGITNYFLAVSIDDGLQGVTHVMRGLDILPLTGAQIAIMQYLGFSAVAHWYHLPLIVNAQGQKLSKQNLAAPIDTSTVAKCQALIEHALHLLKQPAVTRDTPTRMLMQATQQWQNAPLAYQQVLHAVNG